MGSPVLPSLSEATICPMYSTYLFTVRADSDFFMLSTSGFTVMLCTSANGKSPISGRIHFFKAASMLEASLMGSPSLDPVKIRLCLVPKGALTENNTVEPLFRVRTRLLDDFAGLPKHI
jgi:hypothetical protein